MSKQRSWILALLAVGASASCARERDIVGNPVDGSHRVSAFAVIGEGSQTVRKMSTPAPGVRSAEHLEYGQVPAGFRQEIPPGDAKPRPMIPGEKLIVVILTPEFVYRGECAATGPTQPRCESRESAPPEKSAIERALRGEKVARHPES